MQVAGVRRLLIVLFALLNIVFLCMYIYEQKSSDYISEDFVLSAVENLSDRGISVSVDVLERAVPNFPAGKIVLNDGEDAGKKVSDSVVRFTLGNGQVKAVGFDTPHGTSLSYYSGDESVSNIQLAKTEYNNDDFSFSYSDFRYEKEAEAPEEIIDTFSKEISYSDKKLLEDFVVCFGKSKGLGYRISGCKEYEDGTVFSLVQVYGDTDIKDMYMNVLVWNEEILSAKGNWISQKISKNYKYEMTDGVNAAFALDLDDVSEILSERCVYTLKRTDENSYYLLPVWEIKYLSAQGDECFFVFESDIENR